MGLFEAWKRLAYDKSGQAVKRVWDTYLPAEKRIYGSILSEKCTYIEGTVKELGERFNVSPMYMCAFLDGIRDAVDGIPSLVDVREDTAVTFGIEFERLYTKMVEYKAESLYKLQAWNDIIAPERQKELYTAVKSARTFKREEKINRNALCPCGSGKKNKHCCGGL